MNGYLYGTPTKISEKMLTGDFDWPPVWYGSKTFYKIKDIYNSIFSG